MDRSGQRLQLPIPLTPERAYDLLTRYKFAERYVEGRSVACIGCEGTGYGAQLLARASDSVVGMTCDAGDLDLARTYYPAENVTYREANLGEIPYPDAHFDVVVAFEALEHSERPEDLIRAAKRVLKPDGVFVTATPDKQVHSNERNYRDAAHEKEMYVPEFREALERHFDRVSMYRQGTIVGGMVFDPAASLSPASVEGTNFLSPGHLTSTDVPEAHYALAVCGGPASSIEENGLPHLLLDHDRLIFKECEDQREDIQLLQSEISQLQETEVQAFRDNRRIRATEIAYLNAQLDNHREELERSRRRLKAERKSYEARIKVLQHRIRQIENSRVWRVLGAYRLARKKLGALSQNKLPR